MGRSLFHFQEKPKQLGRANAILRVMFAWKVLRKEKMLEKNYIFIFVCIIKKYLKNFI